MYIIVSSLKENHVYIYFGMVVGLWVLEIYCALFAVTDFPKENHKFMISVTALSWNTLGKRNKHWFCGICVLTVEGVPTGQGRNRIKLVQAGILPALVLNSPGYHYPGEFSNFRTCNNRISVCLFVCLSGSGMSNSSPGGLLSCSF